MLGFPGVIVGPIVIGLKPGEALGISAGNGHVCVKTEVLKY